MNIYEDYVKYMAEIKPLVKIIKKSVIDLAIIYDDVIMVCDYIAKLKSEDALIDVDLAEIFESGFSYLSNVFEDLKLYYHDYFKKDIILFKSYSTLILFHFYLDDFKAHLDVSELLTSERKKVIDQMEDEIEDILINNKGFDDSLIDSFEQQIADISPRHDNFRPVYAVYSLISEELELY